MPRWLLFGSSLARCLGLLSAPWGLFDSRCASLSRRHQAFPEAPVPMETEVDIVCPGQSTNGCGIVRVGARVSRRSVCVRLSASASPVRRGILLSRFLQSEPGHSRVPGKAACPPLRSQGCGGEFQSWDVTALGQLCRHVEATGPCRSVSWSLSRMLLPSTVRDRKDWQMDSRGGSDCDPVCLQHLHG
ncbi:hypothetical protein P4O66_004595 [Electrophorus voltai]|uniref:Secreted protein n=1 Tax=Electrophorus voltai TaxID=2609070 RepID=A0AAD8ZLH3_9TELE|nr:hypothetical protein P4O66_004595 [Electrophorus voltai]